MKKIVWLHLLVALIAGGCSHPNAADLNHSPQAQSEAVQPHADAQKGPSLPKPLEQETVFSPQKQAEIASDMTKKEVLTKLLNTVDYFETAVGKFELLRKGKKSLVEYQLSLSEMEGGYSKVTDYDADSKPSRVWLTYYKNGTLWRTEDGSSATLDAKKYKFNRSGATLIPEEAFRTDSQGMTVTTYRERPPIGIAQSSLFPYEIASNFTRDYNDWEIEKQDERLLDHHTIVLAGKIKNSDKHGAQTFRFWVDKDSGILAKYELYDGNSNVVSYLKPVELHVNVPVETKMFEPPHQNKK
ncbi:outer membrane lipoprotein-sorting protein [Brevibacillus agri]|uniref:outer membrane lipoprotein-sorting protein n=1 Tax=Brevibacillus agri TaxID=51101 RepID=UPI002E1F0108|nr:outer membrane lipoprotein-sorting protein [Brevibacillus agri]